MMRFLFDFKGINGILPQLFVLIQSPLVQGMEGFFLFGGFIAMGRFLYEREVFLLGILLQLFVLILWPYFKV